jgi:hypothetical protein
LGSRLRNPVTKQACLASNGVKRKKARHFYVIVEYFRLEFETLNTVPEIQKTSGNRSYFGFQISLLVLSNGIKKLL